MNWTPAKAGTKQWPAWDSECGNYRVVDCSAIRSHKPFRLISHLHEDAEGNPKMWDFATLAEAQEYTDRI